MPLTTIDKQILEKLFQMESGYVLDFSDRTMENFFAEDLGIKIYNKKYNYASGSKANRIRGFFKVANDKEIAKMINGLISYIEAKIKIEDFSKNSFPSNRIQAGKDIAKKLLNKNVDLKQNNNRSEITAYVDTDSIQIVLNEEVFGHVKSLLNSGHYYNAVEESYKIVRKLLMTKTGKERAHEAFSGKNMVILFGKKAENEAQEDFYEGVKFLHMSIQKLRNEKAHTPAEGLDKNRALHYIVLASLAYDLIK